MALQRMMQSNTDVWLMDLVRGAMTRFTFDPATDTAPLWSPDHIAFVSGRKGPYDLYLKSPPRSTLRSMWDMGSFSGFCRLSGTLDRAARAAETAAAVEIRIGGLRRLLLDDFHKLP